MEIGKPNKGRTREDRTRIIYRRFWIGGGGKKEGKPNSPFQSEMLKMLGKKKSPGLKREGEGGLGVQKKN